MDVINLKNSLTLLLSLFATLTIANSALANKGGGDIAFHKLLNVSRADGVQFQWDKQLHFTSLLKDFDQQIISELSVSERDINQVLLDEGVSSQQDIQKYLESYIKSLDQTKKQLKQNLLKDYKSEAIDNQTKLINRDVENVLTNVLK